MEITTVPKTGAPTRALVSGSSGPVAERVDSARPVQQSAVGPFELPPSGKRLSAATLAALAVLAGLGALAFGSLAFFWSLRGDDATTTRASGIETFLARPSTRRVPLDFGGGRVVLAVGSGARAYLVLHRVPLAPKGRSYQAWVRQPGAEKSVSAAVFAGSELVVPLSVKVAPGSTLSITMERSGGAPSPSSKRRVARVSV